MQFETCSWTLKVEWCSSAAVVHIRIIAVILWSTPVMREAGVADVAQVCPALLAIDHCAAYRTAQHSVLLLHKPITHPAPVQPTAHTPQKSQQNRQHLAEKRGRVRRWDHKYIFWHSFINSILACTPKKGHCCAFTATAGEVRLVKNDTIVLVCLSVFIRREVLPNESNQVFNLCCIWNHILFWVNTYFKQ